MVTGGADDDNAILELRNPCESNSWLHNATMPALPLGPESRKDLAESIRVRLGELSKEGLMMGNWVVSMLNERIKGLAELDRSLFREPLHSRRN